MNFILDANIPYSAKAVFHKLDSVVHVLDVGLVDASDNDIIRWAVAHDAIIVTRDLDFANIVAHPISSHVGAIILRVPSHFTFAEIKKVLTSFLTVAEKEELRHAVVIVEPGKYRIRHGV
ncbi:MAG: DUF5615 family PIN-like protein [Candidatus Sungiibacteriota bacterium]